MRYRFPDARSDPNDHASGAHHWDQLLPMAVRALRSAPNFTGQRPFPGSAEHSIYTLNLQTEAQAEFVHHIAWTAFLYGFDAYATGTLLNADSRTLGYFLTIFAGDPRTNNHDAIPKLKSLFHHRFQGKNVHYESTYLRGPRIWTELNPD